MTETLQELFDSRGVRMGVDRLAGVIRGVKILGLESRNGRTYLPEALAAAAPLYEGAKVNVNHPKGGPAGPRDYQDRIGVIRAVKAGGDGLFADFHFNPKHALAEQLLWDAERAPENVGFSHNVEARTTRRGDRVVVEAITRVQSVNLVADPATTRGLFEAQTVAEATPSALRKGTVPFSSDENRDSPRPLTLADLKRDYPQLVEVLVAPQTAEVRRLEAEVARLTLAERSTRSARRRGSCCANSICPRPIRPIRSRRPSPASNLSSRCWRRRTRRRCGGWSRSGRGWCSRWAATRLCGRRRRRGRGRAINTWPTAWRPAMPARLRKRLPEPEP